MLNRPAAPATDPRADPLSADPRLQGTGRRRSWPRRRHGRLPVKEGEPAGLVGKPDCSCLRGEVAVLTEWQKEPRREKGCVCSVNC